MTQHGHLYNSAKGTNMTKGSMNVKKPKGKGHPKGKTSSAWKTSSSFSCLTHTFIQEAKSMGKKQDSILYVGVFTG